MKKSVGLLMLAFVLAACAPSARDSGMAGEVRTESQDAASGEMETDMSGSMTGGDMDTSDMESDMTSDMGMATGGMTGGDMDMMDMGTGGATGGSLDLDSFDTGTGDTGAGDTGVGDTQTGMEGDTEPPTGTLEVAASPAGPFYNDRPGGISDISDERVVRVLPGGSFFFRVNYSDPSGISGVDISLRNSSEQGELPTDSFTIDETASTSTCDDQLDTMPTELNCTIKVDVAPGAQNIGEGGEFAYVFRARVADAAGNSDVDNDRGYVSIR